MREVRNKHCMRVISLVLSLALLFSVQTVFAEPADVLVPFSSQYINSYSAYLVDNGNGNLQIWFNVTGMSKMDQIGATTIILKESTDGSTWQTVKTYHYTSYPSMLATQTISILSHVNYSGTVGRYYKAVVNIWAGKNGGGDSRRNETARVRLA